MKKKTFDDYLTESMKMNLPDSNPKPDRDLLEKILDKVLGPGSWMNSKDEKKEIFMDRDKSGIASTIRALKKVLEIMNDALDD